MIGAALVWLVMASHLCGEATVARLTFATVAVFAGREGRGTGWIVDRDRGRIVTSYHVVGDAKGVDLLFPIWEDGKLVADRGRYERDFNALRQRGRVVRRDSKRDLALIECEHLPTFARALTLGRSVRPGAPVLLLGNRRGPQRVINRNVSMRP